MYSFQTGAGRRKAQKTVRILSVVVFVLAIALIGVTVSYLHASGVSRSTSDALMARATNEANEAQTAVYRLTQSSGTNTMTLLSNVRSHIYALQCLNTLAANIYGAGTVIVDGSMLTACIATLDTADVEKQIANAELDSSDTRTSAEKSYTRSVEDQAADQASAQQELAKAQQEYDTLGLNDYYSTMTTDGNTGKTNREVVTDWYTRYAEEIAGYENTLANLQIQLTQARQSGETDRAEGLQGQIEDYQNRESIAKAQCSIPELGLQGFDAVKKCYESIQNYADALQKAQESYQKSATNAARNVDDAATKLAQSQREDDTLTNLQTALENCTLTATMDGTITALDATVGAVCSGTVATIQDVDNLTVEVTIPASSVGRLKTGLQCNITSDATDDTVTGTLTRIDPVANDSGSFGATVTVNGQDSGLLVGISAKVEIVISTKDNVFTVPRDAVGTNDDGSTYVLRKTGGEGVDMTFEQVAVTEGDTNDYYVEITGSDLNEGDVIRATADLTQGIESGTSDSDVQMMENGDLYVGDGSNMPEGAVVMGGPGGGPGGPGGQ